MSIAIEAKLDSLAAAVSALEVKSDAAEVKLDAVSATANDTQSSVDAMEAKLDASLDAQITSRSSQASVDAIEAKLDAGSATDAARVVGCEAFIAQVGNSTTKNVVFGG